MMKKSSARHGVTKAFAILILLVATAAPSTIFAGAPDRQSPGTSAGKDTLTFFTSDLPPFGTLKDGKPVGFVVEILHEIMKRLGRADTIAFGDWHTIYKHVLEEPNTVLWPPSRTPEREALFKWVGPLIPEKVVLFARKDSGLTVNSLDDAKKVNGIATVTGYASEKLLRQKGFTNLVSHRSPLQCPDALKFGRVDLWVCSTVTMRQTALDANVDPDLFEPLLIVKEIPSYLAFSKSIPDPAVNQWQAALDEMKRDGSWDKIVSKWIPARLLRIGENTVKFSQKERLWIESHPAVKVAHYFHQPPLNVNAEDAHTGYLYDLLSEVLRLAGLKAEFTDGFSSYDAMIDALQDGTVDILTNVNSTRRLSGDIVKTVPVLKIPNAVVARISAPEITRASDLFGRKVAVVKGYAQDQLLNRFPRIEKVQVHNNEEGFKAVRTGRAEYFLNNLANAGYVLKKTFATDLRIAGTFSVLDFPPLSLSFGIHGKNSPLPGIINKSLAAVPVHTLSQLREKWLDEEFTAAGSKSIQLTREERKYLKDHPVIRVAFDVDWPPVEFSSKDPGMKGMAADYLNIMSKLLGVEFEPGRPRPWKEMLKAVEDGELDFFSALSPTPQREKWLDFTDTYLSFPIVIFTSKQVPYIGSLADLGNKPVAVVYGYASHDFLLENHPGMTLLPVRDVKEGLLTVSTGKAFAFIGSLAAASHVMSREGLTDLKVSGKTPYAFEIAMGTRKDNPVLLHILGKALAAISSRERNTINSRWTSVTFEHATDYSVIWRISAVALFMLAFVLYWNRRLQNEIAERKRAEKAAESANRAKSEFLANMTHELRTPLNAILGFAQIMERNPKISCEEESLRIIQRSGNHLLTLINQVLDLSKIEAGRVTVEENCFDLFHLLDELEIMLSLRADKKHLTLNFHRGHNVPRYVCTDEIKLRQVLINLLGNAIKFTDEGSVTLSIASKCRKGAKKSMKGEDAPASSCIHGNCLLRFEIKDSGPGIAPDEMDHVFEAFGQASTGREIHEGTGLGLVISHKFVQLLGGEIHLESKVGKGSTFSFGIPVHVVDAEDLTPELHTSRAIALEPGQSGYRILIVDDKWDNRHLLVKMLEPFGFELREASNGHEVLDIYDIWEPDLIWMDMRMPEMDGFEATKRIREQSPGRRQPVIIAVTASAFAEKRETVMSIGCDDIVIKPFRENDILRMLKKHLEVKFLYAKDQSTPEKAIAGNDAQAISPSDFRALPRELVLQFKESIAALEMDTALTIIDAIRDHNASLADGLQKFVHQYRFEALQDILDQSEQHE